MPVDNNSGSGSAGDADHPFWPELPQDDDHRSLPHSYPAAGRLAGRQYASVPGNGASCSYPVMSRHTGNVDHRGFDSFSAAGFEENGQAAGTQTTNLVYDRVVPPQIDQYGGPYDIPRTRNEQIEYAPAAYNLAATQSACSYPGRAHETGRTGLFNHSVHRVQALPLLPHPTYFGYDGGWIFQSENTSTRTMPVSSRNTPPHSINPVYGQHLSYEPDGVDGLLDSILPIEVTDRDEAAQPLVRRHSHTPWDMGLSNYGPWSSNNQSGELAPASDRSNIAMQGYMSSGTSVSGGSDSNQSNQRSSVVYSEGKAESNSSLEFPTGDTDMSVSTVVPDIEDTDVNDWTVVPHIEIHQPPRESYDAEEEYTDDVPSFTLNSVQDGEQCASDNGMSNQSFSDSEYALSGTTSPPAGLSESPSAMTGDQEKVLICSADGCGRRFTGQYRNGNLARHRRQNHGATPLWISCEDPGCNKTFRRKDARLKHHRKHHPELARPAVTRGAQA